jgi:hypothetical protein
MTDAINDFIELVCDDLQNALTTLYDNDDCDDDYERVRELLKLISAKADSWCNEVEK